MELPRNSVWEFKGSDITEDNLYRILDVMHDIESVVLFPLNRSSTTVRPIAVSIQAFSEQVKSRKARKSEFTLPNFLLVAEDKLPEEHIARRDKNYNLIKGIVVDRVFLFDYATKKRVPHLAEYARKVGLDRKALARLLTQYWRYGQNKMALLPAFSQSGGSGKERK
ncbi:TPA: transposase, partial [Vibrio parahaemolyticus]|nr:transposase [Vibrio parahaemolyticus]